MASLNKIMLIGYLGEDPDVRILPSGDHVAKLRIATTDRRSDGKGGFIDVTEWHRVSLVGKQADVGGTYLKKGSQVYIEGKLRSSVFNGKDGIERRAWIILADRMQMLGKPQTPQNALNSIERDKMNWMDAHPSDAIAGPGAAETSARTKPDIPF